jgi:heme-degrading monooxygenase HmoA
MVVAVFRYRVRPEADFEELESLHERMLHEVSGMPGFISVKDFATDDGEGVAVAEFESLESLDAWRAHPEHRLAQRRGREELFSEYRILVCGLIRMTELRMREEHSRYHTP